MTIFAPANLPASVNTVEKLAAWANGVLYQRHKNTRYQESDASPLIPRVTCQDGFAANLEETMIFRTSLPMNATWRESTGKFFTEVSEISNAAIPAAFLP
jgi:hypothetical protein